MNKLKKLFVVLVSIITVVGVVNATEEELRHKDDFNKICMVVYK